MSDSLGTALPREMVRVRDEVIPAFESLRGRRNVIVEPQIAMMKADLDRAAKAMDEGDTVEMLRVYQSLKETTA